MLVPSPDLPNGAQALGHVLADDADVRAAVAFVTPSGVDVLADLLSPFRGVSVEIVARAADATSPDALLSLRDRLGVSVSVVIGRSAQRFHPKLWLVETQGELHVLSGSGNLTRSGLVTNDEQFELTSTVADSAFAGQHRERFNELTERAIALDAVTKMAVWQEWLSVIKAQQHHRRELWRLQRHLDDREPVADRSLHLAQLVDDLQRLYDLTVEARLPREDRGAYVPSRFGPAIARARNGADPVRLVTNLCRTQSRGFDVLLVNNRADLTVEQLVLDQTTPYHDLFGARTLELSEERLAQFDV